MNQIIVIGRLCAEPDITSTTGGTTVASYRVAVDRGYAKEGQQKTDFFGCVSYGKQAEFVEKYLKKGIKVVVRGEMHLDIVQKDGKNITYPKISVEKVEFAESKRQDTQPETKENDFLNIPEGINTDELPFS